MTRVDRLLGYLLTFQSAGLVRAKDLARRFEVSERTVYRDIDALCQVGVPLVGVAGEGYRLMDGYYLPPVMFTPDEARGLALALSMFRGFTAEGETKQSAETAYQKLFAILPNSLQSELDALQSVLKFVAFPDEPLNFDDSMLSDLQQAIQNQQLVTLEYHSFGRPQTAQRDVEPLQLVLLNRVWLLEAYCRLRQAVRNFRLDRIDAYRVQSIKYKRRALAAAYTERLRFDVRVRFARDAVRWVREEQHYTFVAESAESSGDSIMHYRPRSADELLGWLLRWGTQMEVLEPAALRTKIATQASQIAELHASIATDI